MTDLNGDGHPEFLRADFVPGRAWMLLSEPETGFPAATPAWGALGDPLFPAFGHMMIPLGDVNGDGVHTDFGITAQGKLYAFFPGAGVSAELSADWSWPRSGNAGTDSIDARFIVARGAGDLNGDGFDDVVLSAPPYRSPPAADTAGRISVYAGGRLPPGPGPYLPEPVRCAGQSSSDGLGGHLRGGPAVPVAGRHRRAGRRVHAARRHRHVQRRGGGRHGPQLGGRHRAHQG